MGTYFRCSEETCGKTTASVYVAEVHENRNPGHEMFEIEEEEF